MLSSEKKILTGQPSGVKEVCFHTKVFRRVSSCLKTSIIGMITVLTVQVNAASPVTNIKQLAFSEYNGCAITLNGALRCFGNNSEGQLGAGASSIYEPFAVEVIPKGVTAVSMGNYHICAIVDSALYCWGSNRESRLGLGGNGDKVTIPTRVINSGVTAVSATGAANCVVVNGALKCWGVNNLGQVGNGQISDRVANPTEIIAKGVTAVATGSRYSCAVVFGELKCWGMVFTQNGKDESLLKPTTIIAHGVSAVSVGSDHICAIVDSGLTCWGSSNLNGQLGIGETSTSSRPTQVISSGVTALNIYGDSTCAIVKKALYCWGANHYGEFGLDAPPRVFKPREVFDGDVSAIAVGSRKACVIVSGILRCSSSFSFYRDIFERGLGFGVDNTPFGSDMPELDKVGPLGVWHGSIGGYPIMLCIDKGRAAYYYTGKESEIPLSINSGYWAEFLAGVENARWYFTRNDKTSVYGYFAQGYWQSIKKSRRLSVDLRFIANLPDPCHSELYRSKLMSSVGEALNLSILNSGKIAARDAAAFIDGEGNVWIWDADWLGGKMSNKFSKPHQFPQSGYVKIVVGDTHAAGIKEDGSLWGWGSNTWGQLGGEKINGSLPTKMGDGFISVAATDSHTFAVRRDGTLWAWGGLSSDAKGNVLGTPPNKPVLLGKGYVSVSAYYRHNAALKKVGSLWMWGGSNGYPEEIPRQVAINIEQVSAGYFHTAAIKKDGSLWVWWEDEGRNVGRNEVSHRIPKKVGDDFRSVSAGLSHTLAIKNDGTLWVLGRIKGEDCETKAPFSLTKIGTGFHDAVAGNDFSLAQKMDGSFWVWGSPGSRDQIKNTGHFCSKPYQVMLGN